MNVGAATRIPSGVSDEDGRLGAVESDDGLLDVIDLLKGERIVLSETPMTPLYLYGQELLVHRRDPESYVVLVELLHISAGHLDSLWTEALPLPKWVLEDATTVSFEAEWSEGAFRLLWSAHRKNVGGIVRSGDYERQQAGLIRLNGESGAVAGSEEREPAVVDVYGAYDLALSLELIPFRRGPDRIEAPWSVEGREIFLTRRGLGGESGVFLRILGSDEEPEEREVALSKDTMQDPIVTTDGRTILLYDGAGWELFSALDGSAQGRLPLEQEVAEVSIIGSLVLYALDEEEVDSHQIATRVRRSLHARDRQSGALLWSYFLHDKELPPDPRTYPGEAPPSMLGGAPPMMPGTPFGQVD